MSQWLADAHGVKASYKAVQRLLARTKTERAEVSKAIVREKLGKTVLSDIDRLEKHAGKLDALADKLARVVGDDPRAYLATVEELRKVTETKLHYSGADTPDDTLSELSQAEQRLTGRLDRLAARGREGAGSEGDRADPAGPRSP